MQPDVRALHQFRLDAGLSYGSLALHLHLSVAAVHEMLNPPYTQPHDRTMHRIREFLASQTSKRLLAEARRKAPK